MTSNPRLSIEEQPPPYTEVTSSPDNQKAPSVVESLPEYAALPARADKKPKTSSRSKKCCRWAIYSIFALACVVAGTVVGIVVTKAHRSKGDSSSNPDNTVNPPDVAHQIPKIAALAATECDAATIVVFQDNTGDVYLQGSLRNQTWNATESPSIPPSKILSNNDNGLKVETNLSVVCYGGTNTSYITPLTISVFYLNNISRSRGNGIWSSTFQVFYDTVSNPRPTRSLVLQSHHEVVKVGSQTSISAVSLAEEICLFYLWDWVPATLVEMRAPFTNNTVWTGPFSLNATAYDSSAALAASVNSMGETGIFFMDQDRQLAKYDWSGMGPAKKILTYPAKPITNITRLAAAAVFTYSHINIQQRLFYLQNGRPQERVILEDALNSTFKTETTWRQEWADGVQEPGLIAAAGRATVDGQRVQVFYVGGSDNRTIVNQTFVTYGS